MGLNHSPRITTDGLVLALDAANTKSYSGSGTDVLDISKSKLTTSLANGSFFSAESNSFILDGSNDFIGTPRLPGTGTSTMSQTYIVWVKPLSSNGNILSMSSTNPQGSWNMPPIAAVSNTFRGKFWSNSYLYSSSFVIGNWYHIALTFNYSSVSSERFQKLYVNSNLESSQFSVTYSASGTDNFIFYGQANPGADNKGMFQGEYGLMNVYTGVCLSDDEIKLHFNATRSRFGI